VSGAFPGVRAGLSRAGLDDGKRHRLSAQEQREAVGFAVFGKKEFQVDPGGEGRVTLYRRVIPGDEILRTYTYAEVDQAIVERRKLEVG